MILEQVAETLEKIGRRVWSEEQAFQTCEVNCAALSRAVSAACIFSDVLLSAATVDRPAAYTETAGTQHE